MRLVTIPVFKPPSRAREMAVPSCALNPLASIMFWLMMAKPGLSACCSACASVLRGAEAGAGKSQIEPSVRTPSTSKRTTFDFLCAIKSFSHWSPV